jgi:hypothetical protein
VSGRLMAFQGRVFCPNCDYQGAIWRVRVQPLDAPAFLCGETPQAFSAMLHYLDIWRSMGEEGDISGRRCRTHASPST